MRICFINGSLRGEKSSSLFFLRELERRLESAGLKGAGAGNELFTIQTRVRGGTPEEDLAAIERADAVVIAFPLFVYSLPGALTRLLEDWQARRRAARRRPRSRRVYAIVNCGFALPQTNREAIRVLRNFCRRAGLEWRFAVSIGCGPAVVMTAKVPLLNRKLANALSEIAADMRSGATGERDTVLVRPIVPKSVGIAIRRGMERRSMRRRKKAMAAA